MRKVAACIAIPALLLGVFYAPLLHVHIHPGEAATIHAHLPEFEVAEDENVVHVERPHSHADARSINILITTAAQVVHFDAALANIETISDVAMPCCGFLSIARPSAHSPPALSSLIPRAPPA